MRGDFTVRASSDRAIRAAQLAEKLTEREIWRVARPQQLVGFDMRSSVDEDVFEDALLEWGQRGGDCREAGTAVAMAVPVDRDVKNDGIEEGREWPVGLPAGRAAPEPGKIVFAQRFAHAREDVHDVVGFRCVAADRTEDQAPIALDEKVPGAFGKARFEWSDPWFVHGPSEPHDGFGYSPAR